MTQGPLKGEGKILLRRVVELLPRFQFRYADEDQLHKGIAQVLEQHGIEHTHEHVAGPKDRFDFLLPHGIVIEAKVQGSLPQAMGQCTRYAAREDVSAVVLVTTRFWGSAAMPGSMNGKPIHLIRLRGVSF